MEKEAPYPAPHFMGHEDTYCAEQHARHFPEPGQTIIDHILYLKDTFQYYCPIYIKVLRVAYKKHKRFPYSRHQDCNYMTQYMIRIASHSQLFNITALQIIQYIASEMCIQ